MDNFDAYSRIILLHVEAEEIPPEQKFVYHSRQKFSDSQNSQSKLEKVPPEVERLFAEQTADQLRYHGWIWTRQDVGGYIYSCALSDQRPLIESQLQPYLQSLQGLVKQEIIPAQVLPPAPFERVSAELLFTIPETKFYLMFSDLGQTNAKTLEMEISIAGHPHKRENESELIQIVSVATLCYLAHGNP